MPAPLDLTGVVAVVPPAPEPIDVTLPGGMTIRGITSEIGSSALSQARALLAQANAGLAPLGPVFAIIEAILSIKKFADAVPELIVNPGAVVEAIANLGEKIGKLAALIPQLSVPLLIVGIIDAVIALLEGLTAELVVLKQQEERIEETRATALTLEGPAAGALNAIAAACDAQVSQQRANLGTALASVGPILEIVSAFAEMIGNGPIAVEADTTGGTQALIDSLQGIVTTLGTVRAAIPV